MTGRAKIAVLLSLGITASAAAQGAAAPTADLAARLGYLKATLDLTVKHCRGSVDSRIQADVPRYVAAFPTEFKAAEAARLSEIEKLVAAEGAYPFCVKSLELYGPRGKEVRGAWKFG